MQRPLTGVRVLDLSQFLAGPYGSMILGDLGAEVLKIEIPGKGDGSREMPPHFVHGQSGYFLSMNRSKQSMTLDLKSPAGLEIFILGQFGKNGPGLNMRIVPGSLAIKKLEK